MLRVISQGLRGELCHITLNKSKVCHFNTLGNELISELSRWWICIYHLFNCLTEIIPQKYNLN